MARFYTYLFAVAIAITACNADKTDTLTATTRLAISPRNRVELLNRADAQMAIVTDTITPFFANIGNLDVSLQVGYELPEIPHDSLLRVYRHFLQTHVLGFSPTEKILVANTLRKVCAQLASINSGLFPPLTRCLKTDGAGYGSMTYYTRQNCIVIPQLALQRAAQGDTLQFERTLAHEIFHLIAHSHSPLRYRAYRCIGFDTVQHLTLENPILRDRRIVNPDGTIEVRIRLNDTTFGTLLCYSRPPNFHNLGNNLFGEHFKSSMFRLRKNGGAWAVQTDSLGESTLANTWETSFFRQVGTNTEYLIHPEEILADNFSLLLLQKQGHPLPMPLDSSGVVLLRNFERILRTQK